MIDMITTTLGEVGKVKMCKRILKEQTSNEGVKLVPLEDSQIVLLIRNYSKNIRKNFLIQKLVIL